MSHEPAVRAKGFRRHRAVEQGRSLPPPAPQASLCLFLKTSVHEGRGILSQNVAEKFQWNPVPRHDHCAFCWTTFTERDDADSLREGYATQDDYHWVCPTCFEDFRDLFGWKLK